MSISDKIIPGFKLLILTLLAACVVGYASETANQDAENFEYRFNEVLTYKLNFDYDHAFLNACDLAEDLRDNLKQANTKKIGYFITSMLMLREIAKESGKLASDDYLEVFERKTKNPRVNAFMTKLRSEALLAQGKFESAKECSKNLGFIIDWQIIGPFRNDTNTGMQIAYPPESLVPWENEEIDGSVRKINWRILPFEPFMGVLDFKALFYPYEESCVYTLAIVNNTTPDTLEGTLHVGSTGSYKCFVNGNSLITKDINRDIRFDQDLFTTSFQPGLNTLMFKWGNSRNKEFQAQVRLTNSSNTSLQILPVNSDWWDKLETAFNGWENSSSNLVKSDLYKADITTEFENAIKTGTSAFDYFVLGILENYFETHDKNNFLPKNYLDKALLIEPENSILNYYAAIWSVDESKSRYERELNNKRKLLLKASKAKPQIAAPTYELAKFYELQGNKFQTETYLNQAQKLIKNDTVLFELKRKYNDLRKWDIENAKLMAEAVRIWNLGIADDFVLRFIYDNNTSLGFAVIEKLYTEHDSMQYLLNYLDALEKSGKSHQAESLSKNILEVDPYIPYLRNLLIRNYVSREKYSEALKQSENFIKINPGNPSHWYRKGNFHYYLGDIEEADKAWEEALELNPQYTELQDYLRMKEQTDSDYEIKFFADVNNLIEQAKDQPFKTDYPIEVIYNHDIFNLEPDGNYKHVIYYVKRITNSEGTIEYSDDSPLGFNNGRIYFARIHKKNGDILKAEVDGTWVDYGNLDVGDIIELAGEMQVENDGVFGDYYGERYFFSWDMPVKRAQLTYCFPTSRNFSLYPEKTVSKAEITNDASVSKTIYNWVYTDIEPVESVDDMPGLSEIVDYLEVSTYSSWDEFATWYSNLIKHQLVVTPKIRNKVSELTKDKTTLIEKIKAIYYFVTNSIRYDAEWVFGVHGYKPFTADTILSRQFGDCKDKSILLITMLKVLNVKAYPVMIDLTMHRSKEDVSLAMIGHFNHMISLVEMPDGSQKYLDGTAEFHPFEIIPEYDSDAQVVIIKDGKGVLAHTPLTKPEENVQSKLMKLELSKDGTAKGSVGMFYNGSWEPFVREDYEQKSKIQPRIEKYYTSLYPDTKVSNIKFFDVYDMNAPVEYSYDVEIKGYAKRNNGEFIVKPVMNPTNFLQIFGGNLIDRKYDIILTPPSISRFTIEINYPSNMEISYYPKSVTLESDFMKLIYKAEVTENKIVLHYEKVFLKSRIKTSEFEKYTSIAKKYEEIENAKIRFKVLN